MSVSIKNNRVTIYFSKRRDKDIINNIKDLESGDVSWHIKELIRDGLKYRAVGNNNVATPSHHPSNRSNVTSLANRDYVPQNGVAFDDLLNIEVSKKELSSDETEKLFDNL